jgi:hypothetical protein
MSRMVRGAALALAAVLPFAVGPAGAQTARCDSLAARDTSVESSLILFPAADPGLDPAVSPAEFAYDRAQAAVVGRHFGDSLAFPPALIDSLYGTRRTAGKIVGDFSGRFTIQVLRDGSVSAFSWQRRTASPELNQALVAAVIAASRDHSLLTVPPAITAGFADIPLAVELTDRPTRDPVLVTVAHPYFPVDLPPTAASEMPRPDLPAGAIPQLQLNLLIGADGTIDVPMTQVIGAQPSADVLRAIAAVLPRWRYTPARFRGCPVASWVRREVRAGE